MKRLKVLRLPLKLREDLDRKLDEGETSYVELLSFIRSRHPGADLSWSALYRYAQRYRPERELYREARKAAQAWLALGLERNAKL
ncbi:MAG: phage protein Gp27 family protein [Candidatus Binataceae bacterium]